MSTRTMNSPSPEGQEQLDALRQAVGKVLDKKRRLGQYAVTWQDGKPVVQGEDAPGADDDAR
ncbi:hypothetical protein [Desulfocurvus vexinensis]|uniref:hypothetical protein n=1 Tax=Desulfocurvus vexinensis TaxID=399548 RepID=UPI0004917A14|nr:hypothetical protein [Desulfocurvus vexinensis]